MSEFDSAPELGGAADPYGSYLPDNNDLSSRATSSMWFSTGALACAAAGPFACYVPYLVAIPLGAWGAYQGWLVLQDADRDELGRLQRGTATAALVWGALAAAGAAILVLIVGLVVLAYALMIGGLVAAGGMA